MNVDQFWHDLATQVAGEDYHHEVDDTAQVADADAYLDELPDGDDERDRS